MHHDNTLRVWDPLIRIFHWSLAASFALAYVTEDDLLNLHTAAGYTILGLIGFRLLWGFIGPEHARFTDFVRGPKAVIAYLREIVTAHPRRYLGHNPAGGAMAAALLLFLFATSLSGLLLLGAEEMSGPLAALAAGLPAGMGEAVEEVHEFLANFTLFLVILHVVGVIFSGWQHKENLVLSMITGRKPKQTETAQ